MEYKGPENHKMQMRWNPNTTEREDEMKFRSNYALGYGSHDMWSACKIPISGRKKWIVRGNQDKKRTKTGAQRI